MAEHFTKVLEEVVDNYDIKLSEIDMLADYEKQQLLKEFNTEKLEGLKDKTLHQIFEERVEKTPNCLAVIYEEENLTYKELNEKANQLARVLRAKGIKPNTIVGIMVERSLEMMIGIMGILKAGGAYMPIDPEYPQDRIDYMVESSQVQLLLTQSFLEEKMSTGVETIYLDEKGIYQGERHNLDYINTASDLAYVLYTSGSTGKPKGVMIEHATTINTLENQAKSYSLGEDDSYLLKTIYTFDVSVLELFSWFFGEGKLIVPKKGVEKDPYAIVEAIKKHQITHINFVPSMLNVLPFLKLFPV